MLFIVPFFVHLDSIRVNVGNSPKPGSRKRYNRKMSHTYVEGSRTTGNRKLAAMGALRGW